MYVLCQSNKRPPIAGESIETCPIIAGEKIEDLIQWGEERGREENYTMTRLNTGPSRVVAAFEVTGELQTFTDGETYRHTAYFLIMEIAAISEKGAE